ncbi:hypothetical protein P389DRAFT_193298 [Cystobasidium minutum MCA 4210]|uniref:uncharacterized protein n=1 Tax=Cystobasidium minutum MCA 4210 TaxID=1397322 RepID=UPI0034CD7718|eukprot:jgi/Rhomi1/193298/gm1.1512_g
MRMKAAPADSVARRLSTSTLQPVIAKDTLSHASVKLGFKALRAPVAPSTLTTPTAKVPTNTPLLRAIPLPTTSMTSKMGESAAPVQQRLSILASITRKPSLPSQTIRRLQMNARSKAITNDDNDRSPLLAHKAKTWFPRTAEELDWKFANGAPFFPYKSRRYASV